jgi:TIGR02646 family protein
MKKIEKQPSPIEFENWKANFRSNSGKTLEEIYNTEMRGNQLWGMFPSRVPEDKKELGGYSKQELRRELLSEQGFICCYCNNVVAEKTSIIEHFYPKGLDNRQTFEYNNLLISCQGAQKDPKPRDLHCDANRKEGETLSLSPISSNYKCIDYFEFTEDGQILGLNDEADDTINKLGLNIDKLVDKRKSYIKDALYENPLDDYRDRIYISKETAMQEIAKLKEKRNGKFEPFCSAIIKVLEDEIVLHNE